MDQWNRAGFTSLSWPYWLECFWGCCKWSGRAHKDCHFVYQFLWRHVHSYQDSFNLQQWQTMVHCKTQTAPSGQRRHHPPALWRINNRQTIWINSIPDLRWLSGAVLTTWSLTRSKQWRWLWTSGETPPALPHLPSWTALWLQWSHSVSWEPPSPRTWSGTIT